MNDDAQNVFKYSHSWATKTFFETCHKITSGVFWQLILDEFKASKNKAAKSYIKKHGRWENKILISSIGLHNQA